MQKPVNFINWLFSVLHCSFLYKRNSGLGLISSFLVLLLKAYLELVLNAPLACCFFLVNSIFNNFMHNSCHFFWECTILLSSDWPYIISMHMIFVNDGCHLYTVYATFTVVSFSVLLVQSYIFRSFSNFRPLLVESSVIVQHAHL